MEYKKTKSVSGEEEINALLYCSEKPVDDSLSTMTAFANSDNMVIVTLHVRPLKRSFLRRLSNLIYPERDLTSICLTKNDALSFGKRLIAVANSKK